MTIDERSLQEEGLIRQFVLNSVEKVQSFWFVSHLRCVVVTVNSVHGDRLIQRGLVQTGST